MRVVKVSSIPEAEALRKHLKSYIVDQDEAINAVVRQYRRYLIGLDDEGRPAANILLAGPTGVGKTALAEETATFLCGTPKACLRIDCPEYQYGHEIAKLQGSPPGYLGHRETKPLLTNTALNEYCRDDGVSVLLWDEIEKGHSSLQKLLLGILDKGILTTGANEPVNFARVMIFMTSNLGYDDQGIKSVGFKQYEDEFKYIEPKYVNDYLKRKLAPEFLNRLDEIVVMNYISNEAAKRIAHLQIERVAAKIYKKRNVILQWSDALEEHIVSKGFSKQYGARNIKRAVQSELSSQLGPVLISEKIEPDEKGDKVISATVQDGKVVLLV